MFHLNFAITLFNHGDLDEARRQFELFEECFAADQADSEDPPDQEVLDTKNMLEALLK